MSSVYSHELTSKITHQKILSSCPARISFVQQQDENGYPAVSWVLLTSLPGPPGH